MIDEYVAAVHAKDAAAFADLYTEDARNFDMWAPGLNEGRDTIRAMADGWFSGVGTDEIRVEFQDVQETLGDDVGVLHAFIRFSGVSADGEELRSMTNRITWGLRRTPDGWKIAHEHTSAPLDDTLKGVLSR
ncbi:MAG TPA: SgcJ/EcaC family oxidoreductase [Gaiellaceae bacterium]|nr:SgcJ/EcaC family oxidoreductase [Gaiellaceae bacterium]